MTRVLLVHGAATTGAVWGPVREALGDLEVWAPTRPCSGDLETELDWLEHHARDSVVVGVSGGATLAIGLAARGTNARAILAHEPAVGPLLPELLAAPAAALAQGGPDAFGRTLYGPAWNPSMVGDRAAVDSDVAMFRAFSPAPPAADSPPTLVTTGALSPPLRHLAARRLHSVYGYATSTLPGCRHFVPRESPWVVAALVRATLTGAAESGGSAAGE